MSPRRLDFMVAAKALEGLPYVWGAKGPDRFDCSGLVTFLLWRMPAVDWRDTHNCHALWNVLPETKEPKPMDLAFYGRPAHPSHVLLVWGDGRVFGACGGNSSTRDVETAQRIHAAVKFRPKVEYRPDLLGYRSLAQFLDKERR